MDLSDYSIVKYLGDHTSYKCGYCQGIDSNSSRGMWAYQMTCQDYEDLIERGLRRSGRYVYRPSMDKMCCPSYTIKAEPLKYILTKSQKKVLRRMSRYLITGERRPQREEGEGGEEEGEPGSEAEVDPSVWRHGNEDMDVTGEDLKVQKEELKESQPSTSIEVKSKAIQEEKKAEIGTKEKIDERDPMESESTDPDAHAAKKQARMPRPGKGADPNKPRCKKAKDIRREKQLAKAALKQQQKLEQPSTSAQADAAAAAGSTTEPNPKRKQQREKTLLEYIKEDHIPGQEPKHKLEVKLVRVKPNSSDYITTQDEAHALFQKYQHIIHKEPKDECLMKHFTRFLVESPLEPLYSRKYPPGGIGSFHQHYRLDGKLVGVAVLDILPHSVSAVYFFYDPDYKFLSLGHYSALREIAFVQERHLTYPDVELYYMGFYIHSCPKMKYKGHYQPSYLLCPEAYTWQPFLKCIPKLDIKEYSRLDETDAVDEEIPQKKILTFYSRSVMPYDVFQLASQMGDHYTARVKEYAKVIGRKMSQKVLLLMQG